MKPDARSDDSVVSTTKAPKHGQGLRALVEARRRELELELVDVKNAGASGAGTRAEIEAALSALAGLMTGNLDQIPLIVAAELGQWLETSKYLGTPDAVGDAGRGAGVPPRPDARSDDGGVSTTKAPKHGQGLRALVEARRRELELALRDENKKPGGPGAGTRADIEAALKALDGLMTGDLDQIPPIVAAELSQWLETSKYLGAKRRTAAWKSQGRWEPHGPSPR